LIPGLPPGKIHRAENDAGRGNPVNSTAETRYAIAAVPAPVLAASSPALHAQTAEAPAPEDYDDAARLASKD